MLDIPGFLAATTRVEPSKLSLGESSGGPVTQSIQVSNNGPTAVTYDLSNLNALAAGPNTYTPLFNPASNAVSFAVAGVPATSVTVAAGGSVAVDVTVAPDPAILDRSLYGGYVVLTPQGGGATYSVPYGGFKGDYQSIQVLTINSALLGGPTFNFATAPTFVVHFDHPARRIRADIFRVSDGKSMGVAFNYEYLPRNSAPTVGFGFGWNGQVSRGNSSNTSDIPNGVYTARLTVTKALGSDAETETWVSPQFTVARP